MANVVTGLSLLFSLIALFFSFIRFQIAKESNERGKRIEQFQHDQTGDVARQAEIGRRISDLNTSREELKGEIDIHHKAIIEALETLYLDTGGFQVGSKGRGAFETYVAQFEAQKSIIERSGRALRLGYMSWYRQCPDGLRDAEHIIAINADYQNGWIVQACGPCEKLMSYDEDEQSDQDFTDLCEAALDAIQKAKMNLDVRSAILWDTIKEEKRKAEEDLIDIAQKAQERVRLHNKELRNQSPARSRQPAQIAQRAVSSFMRRRRRRKRR